jgi:hypothetical protein
LLFNSTKYSSSTYYQRTVRTEKVKKYLKYNNKVGFNLASVIAEIVRRLSNII